MKFLEWLHHYAPWSTIGWLAIIAVASVWEISGFVRKDGTTFTDLVRSVLPVWARAIVIGVLVWHFCITKANWVK